ncbi:MAG: hypothetical protein ACYDHN_05810 [Solirubrobacteraceae bacterium]
MAELSTAETATAASACCTPKAQARCCEPSAKADCCGASHAGGGCGCDAGKAADAPASDIDEQQVRRSALSSP